MALLSIFLFIVAVILVFCIRNLLLKNEAHEDALDRYDQYFISLQNALVRVIEDFRRIDKSGNYATNMDGTGAFEYSDDVGVTFKAICGLIASLEQFVEMEANEQKQKIQEE